jgi:hypothetical protein
MWEVLRAIDDPIFFLWFKKNSFKHTPPSSSSFVICEEKQRNNFENEPWPHLYRKVIAGPNTFVLVG